MPVLDSSIITLCQAECARHNATIKESKTSYNSELILKLAVKLIGGNETTIILLRYDL